MKLLPLLNLNPRVALGLVIPKARGAATVEDLVAVHAFSMRKLPVDKGGYEVILHLGSESFLRLCTQEQWTVIALYVGIANCIFHT